MTTFVPELEQFGGDWGSETGQGSVTSWEDEHVIAAPPKMFIAGRLKS